ncbi:unnamed protein product [Didymodactylos carnosus]|uniref:Uncharacterized protein n=1 Tax=Didymodactylos carnosus TaxID=1234261 RepID=A0A814SQ16_9BILA|nr:unnamed protein product [Didymodactylos carnosus]CAF3914301.1 unnamed protein product [Didymodactylos carnosus]
MIRETGAIQLSYPPVRPRTVRTVASITKVKNRLKRRKVVSSRKLSSELDISRTSMRQILKNDLGCRGYKKIVEPLLTDAHKAGRKKFTNWIRNNFRKEQTMKILFSDEKIFDTNGVYNSQNDRIWAVDRAEADKNGGIKQQQGFPQKVMVWLGVCSKGVTPLVILDTGTVDHVRYIKEVLPVALKYGNKVFGDDWTFQQDNAPAHKDEETQEWCRKHLPSFIPRERWPANSPDLNPLDYCIWDEFVTAIKWNKVTSKRTLIEELKRAVKKIRQEVILESCESWTVRLSNISKNSGCYLR